MPRLAAPGFCACCSADSVAARECRQRWPSDPGGNLRRVAGHRAPAVCDRIEEVAHGRLPQSIVIKRSCAAKTASDNHSVAVSGQSMTGRTENVVTFFSAHHRLFSNWDRKNLNVIRISGRALDRVVAAWPAVGCSRCEQRLRGAVLPAFLPVKNSVSVLGNHAATVPSTGGREDSPSLKNVDAAIRFHLRLVLHIASAAGSEQKAEGSKQ